MSDLQSSDSGVVYNYIKSLIQTYLSNNGETDFTKFQFELTADRRPNFVQWDYQNITEPTWSNLENLQAPNSTVQQDASNIPKQEASDSCNSRVTELEKLVSIFEKQISDLITKVNSFEVSLNTLNSNDSNKSILVLKDVSDKLSKVDTHTKLPVKTKSSLLSKR